MIVGRDSVASPAKSCRYIAGVVSLTCPTRFVFAPDQLLDWLWRYGQGDDISDNKVLLKGWLSIKPGVWKPF